MADFFPVGTASDFLTAAAATTAVGTYRAATSRSLATATMQHVYALYRQPFAYRLTALDNPAEAQAQAASYGDPFWVWWTG